MRTPDDRPRCWLLNLDAEDELSQPGRRTPPRSLGQHVARVLPLLRRTGLIAEGDVVLDEFAPPSPGSLAGYVGAAWCPTPRAVRALSKAGCSLPEYAPLAVVRTVNHRAFAASMGQSLPGAEFVRTRTALSEVLSRGSVTGQWLLKRPFGYAGKGRLTVGNVTTFDPLAERWIELSLEGPDGGLQVEPLVERAGDYALHGHVSRAGELRYGTVTTQRCDPRGQWVWSELAGDRLPLPDGALESLRATGVRVAEALRGAGYHGPWGIDAYAWRHPRDGALRWQPLSEINARYSMGWAVGMAPGTSA